MSQILAFARARVDDRVDGTLRREHGVVLIVVAMHPIAPDRIKILELVQVGADGFEMTILAEIGRVRLGDAHDGAVEYVSGV